MKTTIYKNRLNHFKNYIIPSLTSIFLISTLNLNGQILDAEIDIPETFTEIADYSEADNWH